MFVLYFVYTIVRINTNNTTLNCNPTDYCQAVSGQGIDNHLLAIGQVALELGLETSEIISDDVYALANRFLLSTSQVNISRYIVTNEENI